MVKMVGSTGLALAVPQAALQDDGEGCALAFERPSWAHFQGYIFLLDRLPVDFGVDEAGVGAAVDQLRQVVRCFGSPAKVRQLLRGEPQALSGEAPPPMAHAALIWWISGLQASAGRVAAILEALPKLSRDGRRRKEQLQLLGGVADKARRRIAPLIEVLTSFKAPLAGANFGVSEACRRAGEMLQRTQEQVGGLHERVGRLERQLAQLGLFGAHRKQDLLAQLHVLQKGRAECMARASRSQVQLGALDALLDEGAWLEAALAEAVDAMERLRTAWTLFGSGMSRLVTDTAAVQLADDHWAGQALDRHEAIRQWAALERAARACAAGSLVDFTPGSVRSTTTRMNCTAFEKGV